MNICERRQLEGQGNAFRAAQASSHGVDTQVYSWEGPLMLPLIWIAARIADAISWMFSEATCVRWNRRVNFFAVAYVRRTLNRRIAGLLSIGDLDGAEFWRGKRSWYVRRRFLRRSPFRIPEEEVR